MAFADNRQVRPSAVSIGGTLLVNGLAVAGIFYAVPEVFPPDWKGPTFIDIPAPTLPKPQPRMPDKPSKQPALTKREAFDPPPIAFPPVRPIDMKTETEFTFPPAGQDFGGGSGTKIEPPPHIAQTGAKVDPRYAGNLQPAYPPGAMRQSLEGSVTVKVLIGTDGRVKAVEAIRSSDDSFLSATRDQALRKWRFVPATRDGSPIESWREMTVRFEMPG